MKRRTRLGITLAGSIAVTWGFAVPAALAASPAPCPSMTVVPTSSPAPNSNARPGGVPGGACSVHGSFTVNSTLALQTTLADFTLSSGGVAVPAGAGAVYVSANTPGYYISAYDTNFTPASTPAFPGTDVSMSTYDSAMTGTTCGTQSFKGMSVDPLASTVLDVAQSSGQLNCTQAGDPAAPSGYDGFHLAGFGLNGIPGGLPAGTYQTTVTVALWGSN